MYMQDLMIIGGVIVVVLLVVFILITKIIVIAKPSEAVVVAGKRDAEKKNYIYTSGRKIIIPFIQKAYFLDLKPISISIDLKDGLSKNQVRLTIPGNIAFRINGDDSKALQIASTSLMGLTSEDIKDKVRDIVVGQLRQVIATMTIEEVIQDRDRLQENVQENIESELTKIGLTIVNFNIIDIVDSDGYIEALGQKAIAERVQTADADRAEQVRVGQSRVANESAQLESNRAEAQKIKNINIAKAEAEQAKVTAETRGEQALAEAKLASTQSAAKREAEVAKAKALQEISVAEIEAETARLEASEVVPKRIEKQKAILQAEADAEQVRVRAQAEADAILAKYKAEAEGIKAVQEAYAEGYKQQLMALNNNENALLELMKLQKLDLVVEGQVEASKNIKFDKVVSIGNSSHHDGTHNKHGLIGGLIGEMASTLPITKEIFGATDTPMPTFLDGHTNNKQVTISHQQDDIKELAELEA